MKKILQIAPLIISLAAIYLSIHSLYVRRSIWRTNEAGLFTTQQGSYTAEKPNVVDTPKYIESQPNEYITVQDEGGEITLPPDSSAYWKAKYFALKASNKKEIWQNKLRELGGGILIGGSLRSETNGHDIFSPNEVFTPRPITPEYQDTSIQNWHERHKDPEWKIDTIWSHDSDYFHLRYSRGDIYYYDTFKQYIDAGTYFLRNGKYIQFPSTRKTWDSLTMHSDYFIRAQLY